MNRVVVKTQDGDDRIHVSLTNCDPNNEQKVRVELRGATPKAVSGTILSSASMQDHNTFEKPDTVTLKEFAGAVISGSKVILTMPSKSLVTIELQ